MPEKLGCATGKAAAPGSGAEIVFATWGGAEINNLTRAYATRADFLGAMAQQKAARAAGQQPKPA